MLELVNRADLARIKGIGEVYSNLLENAGVDTVLELSKRVPANLHAKLVEQTQTGDARRARLRRHRSKIGSNRPKHSAVLWNPRSEDGARVRFLERSSGCAGKKPGCVIRCLRRRYTAAL